MHQQKGPRFPGALFVFRRTMRSVAVAGEERGQADILAALVLATFRTLAARAAIATAFTARAPVTITAAFAML